jgi:hypothetical protein
MGLEAVAVWALAIGQIMKPVREQIVYPSNVLRCVFRWRVECVALHNKTL